MCLLIDLTKVMTVHETGDVAFISVDAVNRFFLRGADLCVSGYLCIHHCGVRAWACLLCCDVLGGCVCMGEIES